MDAVKREYLRRLCLKSLYHFVAVIMMEVIRDDKDHPRLPLQPFHKEVLDFAQKKDLKRKGILMPRYFLKSTCITGSMPLWLWLNNHEIRTLLVSETAPKSATLLNFVKGQLVYNKLLHEIFPETIRKYWKSPDNKPLAWSNEAIEMPHKSVARDPTIQVIGVGNAAQGIHVDHIFLDDIIGQKDMLSPIESYNTWKWFANVDELGITPDWTKPHASYVYLIGTHYAPEDIYDKVQKTRHEYRWFHVPAEKDGEPTWPEKLSREGIQEMKNDPERSIIFYTEMQNSPMDSGMTAFKPEWKRFYQLSKNEDDEEVVLWIDEKEERHAVRLKELDKSATIDPATISASMKTACRTAIVVVGVHTKTNTKFVLEAWAKKISKPSDLYNKIFEFHKRYRPRRWGIETFSQQNWAKATIMAAARDKNLSIYLRDLPKDQGRDAKARRIEALQEDFACGQIYFHESQRNLIGEYHGYPMAPTNDLIDALGYQKYWWRNVDTEEEAAKTKMRNRQLEWEGGITGYGEAY